MKRILKKIMVMKLEKLIKKIMLMKVIMNLIVMFRLKLVRKNMKLLLWKKMEIERWLLKRMEKKLERMNYLKNIKFNWKI